ncbi:hypothetical protein [Alloscardovia omnicolens]|uniref:hypothetical protein n=1 Tax=Alloscardovia omnicolens TaxID=419015 RepID=UPI003A669EED
MADVKTQLNKIQAAVYGKDVRGAIHDAIDAINEQVDTTTQAENGRKQAESARASAEETRKSQETSRKSAETKRADAESTREAQEQARQVAENKRAQNETRRSNQESERVKAEKIRQGEERVRAYNAELRHLSEESYRKAETAREENETKRQSAEQTRSNQEQQRIRAESTRQTNETGRTATFQELKANIDAKIKQMDGIIAGTNTVVVDATLSNVGQAADAKATGDAIKDVCEVLRTQETLTNQMRDSLKKEIKEKTITDTTLSNENAPANAATVGKQLGILKEEMDRMRYRFGFDTPRHFELQDDLAVTDDGLLNITVVRISPSSGEDTFAILTSTDSHSDSPEESFRSIVFVAKLTEANKPAHALVPLVKDTNYKCEIPKGILVSATFYPFTSFKL